jgi:hypothetical protein
LSQEYCSAEDYPPHSLLSQVFGGRVSETADDVELARSQRDFVEDQDSESQNEGFCLPFKSWNSGQLFVNLNEANKQNQT